MFNQVQIAPQDLAGSETEKTVLAAVDEARRWTLGYGGGLEVQRLGSNNPQGTFKASPRLSLTLGYTCYDSSQSLGTVRGNAVRLSTDWRF